MIPLTQWRDVLLSHGKRFLKEPAYSQHLDQSGKLATRISMGKQPLALTWKTNVTLPPAIVFTSNVMSDTDGDMEISDVQKATDASGFHRAVIPYPIHWSNVDYSSTPRDDCLLSDLSQILKCFQNTPAALTTRSSGCMVLGFDDNDMKRLLGPNEILNNICVNQCSSILQTLFTTSYATASQCAILSSFDLTRIRQGSPVAEIWRKTQYWNKTKWILPIHRPLETHWVLAVIEVQERNILVFDSFGSSYKNWSLDLQVS